VAPGSQVGEKAAKGAVVRGNDKPVNGTDDAVRVQRLVTQTEADEEGGRMPAGPAFVAALAIRTLARCVAEYVRPPRAAGDGEDSERLIGWDILLSGGGADDAERQAAEAADRQKSLQRAKSALVSQEDELVKVGTLNEALTPYMAECLEAIAKVRGEMAPKHKLVPMADVEAETVVSSNGV
jgi:hypothetical protein